MKQKKPAKKTPVKPAKKAPVKKAVKSVSLKPMVKKEPVKPTTKTESQKSSKPSSKPADNASLIKKTIVETPVTVAKRTESKPKPKAPRIKDDDEFLLDLEEKEDMLDEEKKDLAKALSDDDDALDTSFIPTDTSERYILVVDEEGQRRIETVTIISQILPNAIIEVADDPDEAWDIMQDCEFDTYVVNFLMPGYSSSPFVKAVANRPDHPLLLGFAADKISDAVDPKKGLKIIPLKRLFDLDVSAGAENASTEGAA